MSVRDAARNAFEQQTDALVRDERFHRLETGAASPDDYDRFVANVFITHAHSPRYLAFLYSVAPPAAADRIRGNLLEELGETGTVRVSHPDLLADLVRAAGLADRLPALRREADERLRQAIGERLIYASLREVGFAALCEITAFEFMLSRLAGRMAAALSTHRGLEATRLTWFSHHAEVDVRHAEEGLDSIQDYVEHHRIGSEDAAALLDMALRENVFIRRYLE